MNWTAFATQGHHLFAAFDLVNQAVMGQCKDDGATWQLLESLPGAFVYDLAMSGSDLYAARADGLWRRSTGTLSVPEPWRLGRAPDGGWDERGRATSARSVNDPPAASTSIPSQRMKPIACAPPMARTTIGSPP